MPRPGRRRDGSGGNKPTAADWRDYERADARGKSSADLKVDYSKRKPLASGEEESVRLAELEKIIDERTIEEAEAKTTAEHEARRRIEEEPMRRKEAEERRKTAEKKEKAEAEAEARRKAAAEAVARRRTESEARREAEAEARRRTESEARREAEAEARRKAAEEAKRIACETESGKCSIFLFEMGKKMVALELEVPCSRDWRDTLIEICRRLNEGPKKFWFVLNDPKQIQSLRRLGFPFPLSDADKALKASNLGEFLSRCSSSNITVIAAYKPSLTIEVVSEQILCFPNQPGKCFSTAVAKITIFKEPKSEETRFGCPKFYRPLSPQEVKQAIDAGVEISKWVCAIDYDTSGYCSLSAEELEQLRRAGTHADDMTAVAAEPSPAEPSPDTAAGASAGHSRGGRR